MIDMKFYLYEEKGHICIQTVINMHGTNTKSQTAAYYLFNNLDLVQNRKCILNNLSGKTLTCSSAMQDHTLHAIIVKVNEVSSTFFVYEKSIKLNTKANKYMSQINIMFIFLRHI